MNVFLYERSSGSMTLVSRTRTTTASYGVSGMSLSANGNAVAFLTYATDMIPGQGPGEGRNVFLFDRLSGTARLISHAMTSSTDPGNADSGFSRGPVLNEDGSYVAFTSQASNLAPGDLNGLEDAFLYSDPQIGRGFFTLSPCRVFDSRTPADGPALASGVTALLDLHGACGIPATAAAVAVNITLTEPTASGHLTLYPGGSSAPLTSTINFGPGQTRANNAILPLAPDGSLVVTPVVLGNGTVHVIVDVTGYFE